MATVISTSFGGQFSNFGVERLISINAKGEVSGPSAYRALTAAEARPIVAFPFSGRLG